eukprot:4565934-Prymnesium_polylepis.1
MVPTALSRSRAPASPARRWPAPRGCSGPEPERAQQTAARPAASARAEAAALARARGAARASAAVVVASRASTTRATRAPDRPSFRRALRRALRAWCASRGAARGLVAARVPPWRRPSRPTPSVGARGAGGARREGEQGREQQQVWARAFFVFAPRSQEEAGPAFASHRADAAGDGGHRGAAGCRPGATPRQPSLVRAAPAPQAVRHGRLRRARRVRRAHRALPVPAGLGGRRVRARGVPGVPPLRRRVAARAGDRGTVCAAAAALAGRVRVHRAVPGSRARGVRAQLVRLPAAVEARPLRPPPRARHARHRPALGLPRGAALPGAPAAQCVAARPLGPAATPCRPRDAVRHLREPRLRPGPAARHAAARLL